MPSQKIFKPGEKAPTSGQYEMVGPGKKKGPERTVAKDEPLPSTLKPGWVYRLVDKTKHKK